MVSGDKLKGGIDFVACFRQISCEKLCASLPINWKTYTMKNWLFLTIAITSEVVATTALKSSEGFSRFWPSLIVVVGYGIAFYALSMTLRTIPLGIAYAVWSGLGIVLVTLIAMMLYGQRLDMPAIIGIALIILGVVVINLFSKSSLH